MKNIRFVFKYISVFALVFTLCAAVYGSNIGELKKQREEAQAGIGLANERLKEVTAEKNTALSEIETLDDELNAVTDELAFLSDRLELTEAELYKTQTDLQTASEQREQQYDIYRKRVRSQYINGTAGYLGVILAASDVIDLLNRVEYVNRIVETDNDLQERLIETENLITAQLADITAAKTEIEYLQDRTEIKQDELQDAKTRKEALVERLMNDESMYRQNLADLEADDKRIEKLIKDAEAEEARRIAAERAAREREQNAAREREQAAAREREQAASTRAAALNQGGGMLWPVPSNGYISSHYGNRDNPINGLPEFHTGMDIPAIHGSSVVAAEGGVVLSSGWNGGYGNTVIISHGNGLSTLYAHNSRLLVTAGQEVTKGQPIAQIGSTGYSTGPHLHFEVRVNGSHVNPAGYVSR